MPSADAAFAARLREQVGFLQHPEYNYDQLRVYVSGIASPWTFGPDDEFAFDGDETLSVSVGPTGEHDNAGVPEYVFALRQIVATELGVSH